MDIPFEEIRSDFQAARGFGLYSQSRTFTNDRVERALGKFRLFNTFGLAGLLRMCPSATTVHTIGNWRMESRKLNFPMGLGGVSEAVNQLDEAYKMSGISRFGGIPHPGIHDPV